ncbi:alpha amylase, catalytic domain protein [Nocardiopsis alba ATCC BAA-2165]|uniref:Alpha amylase, catalytic domain protein n=1 Tax=Nocardiopsis alba (strain ATCC BAA-2165 / BE74) TaxID=1205910 RepID=J7L4S0_NOCAA|nr:alpha amylase, catalytic domain protein [Nocardiopsis alba ATCC BAA-2165]
MSKDESGPGAHEHAEHGPLAPATGAATGPLMSSGGARDPHWYKHAVFYEVLARGFFDSNGDGTGDLTGLVRKLDYLQWLGIDCLWLLPMYESPLRDGGYDISDYFKILPEFGDTADFVELLDEAHRRGIRVITDLVMNHTSDQHPWFKASREDPDGPYGDFYVWSDTDDRYDEARIIFVDTETSNWTYDEVRGQYYWHRFFSHQPDLNFENPAVQEAILEVLRYWLDLGIDGFRLDAVPYLYEREGTNCENLKETHEFLKRVRAEVDRLYPDRVLLSEANQWPSDVVDYFGDFESGGDECHMNFHFPLMPRMFMAAPPPAPADPPQLPVGDLPAQPRRADPGDGHRRGARLHVLRVRQGTPHARERGDPSATRAPFGQRPRPDRTVHRAVALAPGLSRAVLRRRDRHGRQHLAGRPRRRTDPHAVERRPQRRFLQGRPRAPVPAADHGPGLRLPGAQRGVPAGEPRFPAELDPPHDPDPQAAPCVRHRRVHRAERHQPERVGVHPGARRRPHALRQQPVPVPATRGAGPVPLRGRATGGVRGRGPFPGDRRLLLPAHPARSRLLLVPAAGGTDHGGDRGRPRGTALVRAAGRGPEQPRRSGGPPARHRIVPFRILGAGRR